MAILDIFKRKQAKIKTAKPKVSAFAKATADKEKAVPQKKTSMLAAKVLKEPHVTEKASDLASKNQYVFKVSPQSNKTQIRQAVEELYGVNVLNVRVINIPSKQKRLGKITGERGGYKKAMVKIKASQKIEILPR